MRDMRVGRVIVVAVLAVLTVGGCAWAQADGDFWGLQQFNFANPGARARGFGGAFVALADDATAAYANPAGLAFLSRIEVGVEYTKFDLEQKVGPVSNDGPGTPTYRYTYYPSGNDVSFASAIFPIKKGRLTAGVFYATGARSEPDFLGGATFAFVGDYYSSDGRLRLGSRALSLDSKSQTYGAAIGWRINDRFSIGASVGQTDLSLSGRTSGGNVYLGGSWSLISESNDSAYFATIGGLWSVTDKFTVGASWQKEQKFDVSSALGYCDRWTGCSYESVGASTFKIPTRWALGASLRATDNWVVAFEWDRVEYSDTYSEMDAWFYPPDAFASDYGFTADDVDELHLGTEFSWFSRGGVGFALRAGAWRDTEHLPYYSGDPTETSLSSLFYEAFPKHSGDLYHYTLGFGLSFKHLMIDLAGDTSKVGESYLASMVVRF